MPVYQPPKENSRPVNRLAEQWLLKAKDLIVDNYLQVVCLAVWGAEKGVDLPGVPRHLRADLGNAAARLLSWNPANAMAWLFSNPEGEDDPEAQEDDLEAALTRAETPEQAAAEVLEVLFYRLQASGLPLYQNPASRTAGGDEYE